MAQRITVEAPNKVRYVLEAPDDITDDEINAHVQQLMAEDAKHEAKTGFLPNVKKGFKSGVSDIERGLGVGAEALGLEETAQRLKEASEQKALEAEQAAEPADKRDTHGFVPPHLKEQFGEAVGRFGPTMASSAFGPVGTAVAGLAETAAGAGAASKAGASDENALAVAPFLGAVSTLGVPGFGAASKAIAGEASKSIAGNVAKGAVASTVGAVPAAVAYEALVNKSAGKPLPTPEEMAQTAKEVAPVAAILGGAHGAFRAREPHPFFPDHVVQEPVQEQAADNIPEAKVRGKQTQETGAPFKGETDEGIIHDVDSLSRNFDLKNAEKRGYNLWGIRNVNGEGFARYSSLEDGLNHINGLLERYKTKHNINTPNELAHRYAPPKDHNDTAAYAKNIADHLNVDVNGKIDLTDAATRQKVIWAITRQEGIAKLNKYGNYKPYEAEGKSTPDPLYKQLGLRSNSSAKKTLDSLDLDTDEGVAEANNLLKALHEEGKISDEHLDIANNYFTERQATRGDVYQKGIDEAQAVYDGAPTPENKVRLEAAQEKLNTHIKSEGLGKQFEEALPKQEAQPEVQPHAFMPEHLQTQRAEPQTLQGAKAELLSNPSTVVREREQAPSLAQSLKNTTANFLKNHVDKWAGLMDVAKYHGDYVGDKMNAYLLGHQLDKIGTMMPRVLSEGGMELRPDGQSVVVKLPIKMHDGSVKDASVKNMIDHVKGEKDGQDILHEILWVKDQERMQQVNPENVSARVSKDPEGFAKKVEAVNTILREKPVFQDSLNMLKEINKKRVKYLRDTGAIDDDMFKFFNEQEMYVPNYTLRDEATDRLGADSGKKVIIGNTATRAFRERTQSDHDINPMENIANEMLRSYLGGARNYHKQLTAEQLQRIGKASYVGRTKNKAQQGNFAVMKNGKRQFYELHDPTDYPVMQVISEIANPIMLAARGASQLLRVGVTNTPNFWKRQLFIDPIAASLTSNIGWVTPAHTMYEVTKILRGDKKILDKLMDAGAISHVDPTLDPRETRALYKEIGTRTVSKSGLEQFKSQLRNKSEFMHILVDGATRCAIYNKVYAKALKDGMSPEKADGFAIMKAREAINFSVSGSAEMQRTGRQLIPFLGAGINALELMRKNWTMGHVKLEDRPAYRRQFLNKVFTVGMLSGLHAMLMAGDPDYEEAKNSFKYSRVAIPTGDKDTPLFGLDLPPDMTFLYWMPALAVEYSLGTKDGQEVWNVAKDQLISLVPGGLGYTGGVPIPQIARPAIELTMGKSFFTGEDIVPKSEQQLPATAQGEYTATEGSKRLGKAIGVSPTKIDYAFKGYLGELGNLALWAVDGLLEGVGATDTIQKPEKHWTQTPGVGAQSTFGTYLASQSVEDMYNHKEKADEARKYYNHLAERGEAGAQELKEFTADPKNITLVQMATLLDRYAKRESDITKQIHLLQNSPEARETITARINALKQERNETAKQAEAVWNEHMK